MPTLTLTKTQTALLTEAAASHSGRCITMRVTDRASLTGTRKSAAARALRDAGLLERATGYTEIETRRGISTLYSITEWQITGLGRIALAGK